MSNLYLYFKRFQLSYPNSAMIYKRKHCDFIEKRTAFSSKRTHCVFIKKNALRFHRKNALRFHRRQLPVAATL
jgi:hypothetical protein